MAESAASLKEENVRLRARIQKLEHRLRESKRSEDVHGSDDVADTARELPQRTLDELTRLTRGLIGASIEQLKMSAEVMDRFATELADRNRPGDQESAASAVANLPRDILAGWVRAMDESLKAPPRTIQSFVDNYNAPLRKKEDDVERTDAPGSAAPPPVT